jgi:tetratricopeptide (TPR) repeat protein
MSGRDAIIAAALVTLTLGLYAPVVDHGFINFDDPEYVVDNPHVTGGLTRAGVVWAFTHPHSANWHPLTWLSHMLDCELFGLDASAHHLVSVAVHAAASVALFAALSAMTGATWPSALVAALFALHPLRVESVAWIAERKDVLSGLFWMLALGAYAAWVRRPGPGRYALLVAAFTAALLAKPMAVTLPAVLLLLDWWPLRRTARLAPRRLVGEKLPLFVLAAAVSVVTVVVQHEAGAVSSLAHTPLAGRVANALVSYATYLGKAFWPSRLAVFYPYTGDLPAWQVAGAAVLLAALSAVALREARRRPYVTVGWLWFLVTLAPVIGIVRAGDQAMADRFTYVPLVGIAIVVAWGGRELLGTRPALAATVAGAALVACALATSAQLAHWRSTEALFAHALAVTADNHLAHTNLGEVLMKSGRPAEATEHFTEALRLRPGSAKVHVNYGMVLAGRGERDAAARHYAEAVRLDPRSAMAHYNWGLVLAEQSQLDEAIGHYREALRLDPRYANAHTNLGWALAEQGRLDEAVAEYRAALGLRPDLATAHNNLAVALEDLGRTDEAAAHYREAARLTPADWRPRYNLAALLVRTGRVDEGIAEYRTILRSAPATPEVHHALGGALAARGDGTAAAAAYREALRLRPGWPPAERGLEGLVAGGTADAPLDGKRDAGRSPGLR